MTRNEPFYVVVPVRGVVTRPESFSFAGLSTRTWWLVGPDQFAELGKARGRNDSLLANLEHLWKRLNPSSLLVVQLYECDRKTVWDEYLADLHLSAINMALLLSDTPPSDDHPEPRPFPAFRARYYEYCDLPLSFDQQGTKTEGHTSRMGMLAGDNPLRLSLTEIDARLACGPQLLRKVIDQREPDARERRLVGAALSILQAFDTLSTGAFVSHLVGVAETLVDTQASDGQPSKATWDRRLARMGVLLGPATSDRLGELAEIRHKYVHSGTQPPSDLATFHALAFAVQLWSAMAEMLARFRDYEEVMRILDCVHLSRYSKLPELSALAGLVPAGGKTGVPWIVNYLQ